MQPLSPYGLSPSTPAFSPAANPMTPMVITIDPRSLSMQQGLSPYGKSASLNNPTDSPVRSGLKSGANAAFSIPQIGFDALMGTVWMGLFKAYDSFKERGTPNKGRWSPMFIPMMVAFGIILRTSTNGFNGYKAAKAQQQGISFQV